MGRLALLCALVTASLLALVSSAAALPARVSTTFVVLQMNLCNSGMAVHSCYSFGRAVDEAVALIHRYPPELVTLQEVCRDDLYAAHGWGKLARAMADLYGSRHVAVDFAPAYNRDTHDWYRCTNGQLFGDAVMAHYGGHDVHRGLFVSQDSSEEERAWTCITVIPHRLTGCTTHLSTNVRVAWNQCRELSTILASSWVQPEVIVSGDFNLKSAPGRRYDVGTCAPSGYGRRDDGTLQQVFYSPDVEWVTGDRQRMHWTDHPLLYERFRV